MWAPAFLSPDSRFDVTESGAGGPRLIIYCSSCRTGGDRNVFHLGCVEINQCEVTP
jgi:hypothetical protein